MKQDYDAFTFDLDGTLAESKSAITAEISDFLRGLLATGKTVGVISGGRMKQFEEQFLTGLDIGGELKERLYLMPTSGAAMYRWIDGQWKELYAHRIPESEFQRILAAFDTAFERVSFERPVAKWGEQIEHRDTQVTFSALGQQAPVAEKNKWENAHDRKLELAAVLSELLPEYSVKPGGTTSVDITHRGIDKRYGMQKFFKHSGHTADRVIFAGDALYEGGNDHVVVGMGVDTVAVEGPQHLLELLGHFTKQN
jgi:phosphomannomutase